jgi:hypothetical protein
MPRLRSILATFAALSLAGGCGASTAQDTNASKGGSAPARPASADRHPVIVVAGDIADGHQTAAETARLIAQIDPVALLTTGDNAYPDGSAEDYRRYYAPTWGRYRSITRPTPGNHEYHTPGAAGYFGYFGSVAGPANRGYYSFDVGSWHLISLNSEIAHGSASAQVRWLRRDLKASRAKCTLAYWHHPRFTAGKYSDFTDVIPLWRALHRAGADVVLNGHDHNYQRYPPMDPDGRVDKTRGIRQFVVGTGGRDPYTLRRDSRRVVQTDSAHGVLRLVLRPSSYDFSFVATPDSGFRDEHRRIPCH